MKKFSYLFLIFFMLVILIVYFSVYRRVNLYYVNDAGELQSFRTEKIVFPLNKAKAARKVLEMLTEPGYMDNFNLEIADYMKVKKVEVERNHCVITAEWGNIGGNLSSFSEDMGLMVIFKSINGFNKNIDTFRFVHINKNPFKHISTDFWIKLDNNNLIIEGQIL